MNGIDFSRSGGRDQPGFAAWLSRACWGVVAVIALTACAVAASGSSATGGPYRGRACPVPDDQATTAARLIAEHQRVKADRDQDHGIRIAATGKIRWSFGDRSTDVME